MFGFQLSALPCIRILPLIFVLCGSSIICGCHKVKESQPDVLITHELAPEPPTVGPVKLILKITDSSGQPILGALIKVEGNMSHAGMAPVYGSAREVERGIYQVPLELTMSGDWILLADITLANGRRLERQIDVKGVEPAHK